MLDYFAISGLINGLTSTALGLFVYTRDSKDLRYITYSLFCLSVSVWSFFYFFWQISSDEQLALFHSRGLIAASIFIPVIYLNHVLILTRQLKEKRKILLWGYVAASGFLLADFTPLMV